MDVLHLIHDYIVLFVKGIINFQERDEQISAKI